MKDFGARLKQLRTRRGLTQDQLARALFVTRQTISNYETGKSEPDLDTLEKLGTILEPDPGTLLGGPSEPERHSGSKRALKISAAVSAALLLVLAVTRPWAERLIQRNEVWLILLLWQVWRPVTLGLLGRTVMEGVLLGTKPVSQKLRIWSRRILWPLTGLAALLWMPMFVGELVQDFTGSVKILNWFMPEFHDVFLFYHLLTQRWYRSCLLWGAALRLTRKPQGCLKG